MVDPVITPLAAFGLSMAILNILVNTVRGIHERGSEINDMESIIKTHINTIRSCSEKYDTWKIIWDEQDQLRIFGVDGSERVGACKSQVEDLIYSITKTLRLDEPAVQHSSVVSKALSRVALSTMANVKRFGRKVMMIFPRKHENSTTSHLPRHTGLEIGDCERWQQLVDSLQEDTQIISVESVQPDIYLWRRVLGILGPNARLKEQISRLKNNVAALPEIAEGAYRKMGHGSPPKDRAEVTKASDTKCFQDVTRVLRECMSSNKDDADYFLELHFSPCDDPDAMRDVVEHIIRDCEIKFFARPSPGGRSTRREMRLKRLRGIETSENNENSKPAPFDLNVAHLVPISEASILNLEFRLRWTEQSPAAVTKTWEALLGLCEVDPRFRKYLQLEGAHFAYGLVIWFILLWETDWFDHVCACAFRSIDFQSPSDGDAFDKNPQISAAREVVYHTVLPGHIKNEAQALEAEAAQEASQSIQVQCRGETKLEHRLFRLGVLLAKLAHGEPIQLDSDISHKPRSDARGRPTGRFKTYYAIRENLPDQLQRAIGFCFDNATKVKWSAKSRHAAERLDEFLLNVVKPVMEYYKEVREHEKTGRFDREFTRLDFPGMRQDKGFEQS